MLQYPLQLPPLSLASSPKLPPKDHDHARPNDPRFPNSLTKRLHHKDSLVNRPTTLLSPLASPISSPFSLPSASSTPPLPPPKLPRSPYISSRPLSTSIPIPNVATNALHHHHHHHHQHHHHHSSRVSSGSSTIEDVLSPGDIVGEGCFLQGDLIRLASICAGKDHQDDHDGHRRRHHHHHVDSAAEPAKEFEVVRRLGSGSYAVVYLVKEVLSRPPVSEDGHMSMLGPMELDDVVLHRPETVYGREYAIKCLSKANLDDEALDAQMTEVTIHQSLHSHPNIVTLHRTLETFSFLLLLLEYVPGEDLFYFLEQARDHYTPENNVNNSGNSNNSNVNDDNNSSGSNGIDHPDSAFSVSRTPPTPSLLSNLHPSQLLSRTRLRLIASMFAQMCDAVASCHAQRVFHRDIKPENFIVTDGWVVLPDGRQERKVVVKLTDFGLSTKEVESSDMDCGSAPYMSYECRNNVAPTYRPRAADVWSLGIVLINMLYHYNPWTDTAQGACPSFDLYRRDPINFFMYRFTGMTRPVAEFLANRVFCILDDTGDDSPRVTASEFGMWIKNLPTLLGGGHGIHRTVSNSSTQGHPIASSTPLSHRPTSRHPSVSTKATRTPLIVPRSLSRAPSLGPAYEKEELSTVYDQELLEEQAGDVTIQQEQRGDEPERMQEGVQTMPVVDDDDFLDAVSMRTTSTKRRKRGARKGKSAAAAAAVAAALASGSGTTTMTTDETLITLTVASQALAREISRASRASSTVSVSTTGSSSVKKKTATAHVQTPMPAGSSKGSKDKGNGTPATPVPTTVKKPSKWKLSFGKQSTGVSTNNAVAATEEVSVSSVSGAVPASSTMSTTATNVTNLIMSLNAPVSHSGGSSSSGSGASAASTSTPIKIEKEIAAIAATPATHNPTSSSLSSSSLSTWTRGRRGREASVPVAAPPLPTNKPPGKSPLAQVTNAGSWMFSERSSRSFEHEREREPEWEREREREREGRGVSPNNSLRSGRSGRPSVGSVNGSSNGGVVASSASSMASVPASGSMSSSGGYGNANGNWRSSMMSTSSAGTSSSVFTRYSNSSNRSISTTATSVSSGSWRTTNHTHGKASSSASSSSLASSVSGSSMHAAYPSLPKNIKIMTGVPWELDQLPRGQYPNPVGDIFGSPPPRKQRTRKTKDSKLDTINERPGNIGKDIVRRDASTSTTDLVGVVSGGGSGGGAASGSAGANGTNVKDEGDGANVKKVQKGQINALAKMLSALRRP